MTDTVGRAAPGGMRLDLQQPEASPREGLGNTMSQSACQGGLSGPRRAIDDDLTLAFKYGLNPPRFTFEPGSLLT